MRRVLVIGSSGAGKSTLSRDLAARLGLPVLHLDEMYWRPGWQPTPKEEWAHTLEAALARDAWIMDGNYASTLDMRISAADAIVFLDLPRVVCLWRILRRRLHFRSRARPDMAPGCPERLTMEFIAWVWNYPRRQRPKVLRRLAAVAADKRVIVLRSPGAVNRFLNDLPAPA